MIVASALDREGALGGGRQEHLGGKVFADRGLEPEANHPGGRDHDRVVITGLDLSDPGIDVAANRPNVEIGTLTRG